MSSGFQNSNAGGSRSRSMNGCWTCKLRKKKCDETRPLCLACKSLGIDCHGYDCRPSWMDKGWRQREEIARIKAKITKRGWKKTADRQSLENSSTSPSIRRDSIERTNAWADDVGFQGKMDSIPPPTDSRAREGQSRINESDGSEDFGSAMMSPFSLDPPETSFDELLVAGLPIGDLDDTFNVVGGFDFDIFKEYPPLPTPGQADQGAPSNKVVTDTTAPLHSSVDSTRITAEKLATVSTSEVWRGTNFGPSKSLEGPSVEESSVLAYFMDNTSAIQFPFRFGRLSVDNELGWLSYLLFRSSAARKVTVALAGAYRASINDLDDVQFHSPPSKIARHVLSELSTTSSSISPLDHDQKVFQLIETCFCYLQNLILETLQEHFKFIDWIALLQEVAPAVRSLVAMTSHLFQSSESKKQGWVHKSQFSAVRIILGYLVWFDMQATSLCHKGSFLGIDRHQLIVLCLEEMERVSGCGAWVVTAISDILDLSAWRTQAEEQGRLSIFELVQRGNVIFNNLSVNLDQPQHVSSEDVACSWSLDLSQVRGSGAITAVYAYAAITYLHVMISGPNPHLAEIKEAVSQAVKSFRDLAFDKLAADLTWPICVVGCLAEGEDRTGLQQSISNLYGTEQRDHKLQNVIGVIQDCWKMRDEGRECDWSVIMNQMMSDREQVE